ncbi:hypothetical protein DL98DRAFT_661110 [Cadophora sp. DSE1049]|nr:hypothetical protein DL98DRAFT_661110 [Cadophora sp. DSE1049]
MSEVDTSTLSNNKWDKQQLYWNRCQRGGRQHPYPTESKWETRNLRVQSRPHSRTGLLTASPSSEEDSPVVDLPFYNSEISSNKGDEEVQPPIQRPATKEKEDSEEDTVIQEQSREYADLLVLDTIHEGLVYTQPHSHPCVVTTGSVKIQKNDPVLIEHLLESMLSESRASIVVSAKALEIQKNHPILIDELLEKMKSGNSIAARLGRLEPVLKDLKNYWILVHATQQLEKMMAGLADSNIIAAKILSGLKREEIVLLSCATVFDREDSPTFAQQELDFVLKFSYFEYGMLNPKDILDDWKNLCKVLTRRIHLWGPNMCEIGGADRDIGGSDYLAILRKIGHEPEYRRYEEQKRAIRDRSGSVILWDVVVTITKVDSRQADLFFALKGGLNRFGIVTSIIFKTVSQPNQVYGGIEIYGPDALLDLIKATETFQNENTDPKAQLILTINGGLLPGAILILFYDGPTRPAAFEPYNNINGLSISTVKTQSFSSFAKGTPSNIQAGHRGAFHTLMTTGLTENFMKAVHNESSYYGTLALLNSGSLLSYDVEPFLKYGQYATDSAFPHASSPLPLNLYFAWDDPSKDAFWRGVMQQSIDYLTEVAKKEGIFREEDPAYPNYALDTYSGAQLYGTNVGRLRRVQQRVDPNGVMGLAGGFRI